MINVSHCHLLPVKSLVPPPVFGIADGYPATRAQVTYMRKIKLQIRLELLLFPITHSMSTSISRCNSVHCLEDKKKASGHELFEADDRLLDDSHDAQDAKRLEDETHLTETSIRSLETDIDAAAIRTQEKELGKLCRRKQMPKDLMELAAHEPSTYLTKQSY